MDRLREIGPTILADAGDFAAAADLDIDVGVVGNHEFEWGIEHLRSHAPETGYPLLCANSPESHVSPDGCRRDGRWRYWFRRHDLP